MLYTKSTAGPAPTLNYACKLCTYSEVAPTNLIYRNRLKKEAGDVLANVPPGTVDDPTLSRSTAQTCSRCGHREAVFFQSTVTDQNSLPLVFVCAGCGHKWVS